MLEEGLAMYRQLGDDTGVRAALNNLATLAYDDGNRERARALWQESARRSREAGDDLLLGSALNNLADVAVREGQFDRAAELTEEAVGLARKRGDKALLAEALENASLVLLAQNRYGEAVRMLREGIFLAREVHSVSTYLEKFAAVAAQAGARERAARLIGAAEALRDSLGAADQPTEAQVLASALETVRSSEFDAFRAAGAAITPADAVAYALEEEPCPRLAASR
jgi:tetratricopeptide (TPR) repeat protein